MTKPRRLTRKFILYIVVFGGLVAIALSAAQLFLEYKEERNLVKFQLMQIQETNLASITEALWINDDKQLDILLDGLIRLPNISYLQVHHNGNVLMEKGKPEGKQLVTRELKLIHKHKDENHNIGTLKITATLDNLTSEYLNKAITSVFLNIFIIFIIVGYVYFLFYFIFLRHVFSIVDFANNFNVKGNRAPLSLNRSHTDDEISDLRTSLNSMVSRVTTVVDELEVNRTEIRLLNQELESRVRARTAELKSAMENVVEANKAKSYFMASMSHELRTPLNSVLGFADMIEGQYLGPMGNDKYVDYAKDIKKSGRHLLGMINEILDVERIEAGEFELSLENVDVPEIVSDCQKIHAQHADQKDILLDIHVADQIPPLYADRRAVLQVLINLITNAIKFTPNGGTVTLSAMASDQHHQLIVSDTGIGIPGDHIPTLTKPFTRHSSDPHLSQDGVGLGLAITKSLIDLHHGSLDIASDVGKGTTITVTLPNTLA